MTANSPDNIVNSIITAITNALPVEERMVHSDEVEYAARLLASLLKGHRNYEQVEAILKSTIFTPLQSALSENYSLINFINSQVGDVSIGDISRGDIFKNNIFIFAPSWKWNHYGKEIPTRLIDILRRQQKIEDEKQERTKDADYKTWNEMRKQKANDNPDEVEKSLIEKIQDIYEEWGDIDWQQAVTRYAYKMHEMYGFMQIFGMSQRVSLSDIFTEIYLLDKPSAWRRHSIDQLKKHAQMQPTPLTQENRYEGVEVVGKHYRLFILGQPGSGKTTFLKHLVMLAVEGEFDKIPIFVSLKTWGDSNYSLMEYIVKQFTICNFPDTRAFIENVLRNGDALILFDGLDEVNYENGRRLRIIDTIREFTRQYDKSKVVITCRTAATEYVFEQFTYCELADFTLAQINIFILCTAECWTFIKREFSAY